MDELRSACTVSFEQRRPHRRQRGVDEPRGVEDLEPRAPVPPATAPAAGRAPCAASAVGAPASTPAAGGADRTSPVTGPPGRRRSSARRPRPARPRTPRLSVLLRRRRPVISGMLSESASKSALAFPMMSITSRDVSSSFSSRSFSTRNCASSLSRGSAGGRQRCFESASVAPLFAARRHSVRCAEYRRSRRRIAAFSPGPVAFGSTSGPAPPRAPARQSDHHRPDPAWPSAPLPWSSSSKPPKISSNGHRARLNSSWQVGKGRRVTTMCRSRGPGYGRGVRRLAGQQVRVERPEQECH
jgi:hypothetical protein